MGDRILELIEMGGLIGLIGADVWVIYMLVLLVRNVLSDKMKTTHETAENINPCEECHSMMLSDVKGRRCEQCRYGYMPLEDRIELFAKDKENAKKERKIISRICRLFSKK